MSKEITPMRRYSTLVDQMKKNIAPYFNEVGLNKVDPKYKGFRGSYWRDDEPSYTKGVDSDFILIFQNKGMAISFALSFNYINLPKEMQTVVATVKTKDTAKNIDLIVGSKPINLDMFKSKVIEFNKLYEINSPGATDQKSSVRNIAEAFSKIFIDQKLDLKQEVENALEKRQKLEKKVKDNLNYEELYNNHKEAKNILEKAKTSIDSDISLLAEKREIDRLESLLKDLRVELAQRKSAIEKKHKLKEKKDAFNKVDVYLIDANEAIKKSLDLFDRSLIKDVRQKVKAPF